MRGPAGGSGEAPGDDGEEAMLEEDVFTKSELESGGREAAAGPDLEEPSLYFNRELSWLDFNKRVLELAEDATVPLLERVKFCTIYASNLDEFFMVRVAGLWDQVDAGIDARGPDGLAPREQIAAIRERTLDLDKRLQRCFEGSLRPALEEHGIKILTLDRANEAEREEIAARFHDQVFPALTPLVIGMGGPSPTSPTSRSAWRCCCATRTGATRSSPASRCRRSCSGASFRSARATAPSSRSRT